MSEEIGVQKKTYLVYYGIFAIASVFFLIYYLSNTILYFTTPQQFPINSFKRFPLTYLIFPAELFSFFFGAYFTYNLFADRYRKKKPAPLNNKASAKVAILLPVYNEPKDIVERTITACTKLKWDAGFNIYLLDDSTNAEDKKNIDELARKYNCITIRRKDRTGYKAGNINNAIKHIKEEYFAIFDSDQAPEPDFLEQTMDYFNDSKTAFVQTPQYFINESSPLERAIKVGANIFYHAQCVSKSMDGAMPFCGTNAVIRTKVFKEVKGFSYYTATEDIELGLRMNEAGYRGEYVPKILVYGYAPPDFKAYSSQQYRWANGNLAILRECWLKILGGNFSFRHQVHTLFTLGWWLIGITTLLYMIVPLISLFTGMGTHHTWMPTHLLAFLYLNVGMGIGMIYMALQGRTQDKITIKDAILQYSLITNSIFIYSKAAINALFRRYIGFVRTHKKKTNSGLSLIKWNLIGSGVFFISSIYALYNATISQSIEQLRGFLPLSLWLLFYSIILTSSIIFVEHETAVPVPTESKWISRQESTA